MNTQNRRKIAIKSVLRHKLQKNVRIRGKSMRVSEPSIKHKHSLLNRRENDIISIKLKRPEPNIISLPDHSNS